jgi:hypothetical protein
VRHFHLVAVLAVAPACIIESRNVNVGQVPRASVPFANTAPTHGVVALNAGASSMPTVTDATSTNRASGAEVPDTQARGELIFRPTRRFYVGGVFERGFGHQVVDESLPASRSGNVTGFGMIFGGTLIADPSSNFSLGLNVTLMNWSVPYDQYTTATVDFAGIVTGVSQYMSSDTDSTGTIGLGLWPSYTFGELRLFGGGYVTQKPTVNLFTKDTTVVGPVITSDEEDVIGNDAVDLVLAAGAEYSITPEFAITAIINQEVLGSTMRTGPSIQLAASIRLGKHTADRRREDPVVVPPPPMAPPPGPPPSAPYPPAAPYPPPAPLPPPPPM